jgi:hypothetical protein
MKVGATARPRQLRRYGEELRHLVRLTIHDEQNILSNSDLREFWRAWLFPSSFDKDSDFGAITFSR